MLLWYIAIMVGMYQIPYCWCIFLAPTDLVSHLWKFTLDVKPLIYLVMFIFSAYFQEIYSRKVKTFKGCRPMHMKWSLHMKLLVSTYVSYFTMVWFIFFRFHTYDYARHFVSACTRILGLEGTPEGVEDQGRLTRVAAVIIKTIVFMSYVVDILKVYCNLISILLIIPCAFSLSCWLFVGYPKQNEWFFSLSWAEIFSFLLG